MPEAAILKLVSKQTTVQQPPSDSYGAFLRRFHRPAYHAALRTYAIIDGSEEHGRARRLADCRENAWFTRHFETGEVRIAASACSLRWCPVCNNSRRNYMTHTISEWIGKADHPKFLTLTLKHSTEPLFDQINTLYRSFQNLRRRAGFKKPVTGGIWFFQIKKSKHDGLWHPHLHAVITGRYLSKFELSRMWLEITETSQIVDVRMISDPQGAASDIARYATSPGSLVGLSPDDAVDLINVLNGRRIYGKWGSARHVSLRPERIEDSGKWKNIGSWYAVVNSFESDANARAIVSSWKNKETLPEGITCLAVDKLLNNLSDEAWANYDFESVYEQQGDFP